MPIQEICVGPSDKNERKYVFGSLLMLLSLPFFMIYMMRVTDGDWDWDAIPDGGLWTLIACGSVMVLLMLLRVMRSFVRPFTTTTFRASGSANGLDTLIIERRAFIFRRSTTISLAELTHLRVDYAEVHSMQRRRPIHYIIAGLANPGGRFRKSKSIYTCL